jgi:hypothetical protein
MFSTYDMSKARQDELYKAAKQPVSRPRLGQFGKQIVRLLANVSDRLIERRQGRLEVLLAEMKG